MSHAVVAILTVFAGSLMMTVVLNLFPRRGAAEIQIRTSFERALLSHTHTDLHDNVRYVSNEKISKRDQNERMKWQFTATSNRGIADGECCDGNDQKARDTR